MVSGAIHPREDQTALRPTAKRRCQEPHSVDHERDQRNVSIGLPNNFIPPFLHNCSSAYFSQFSSARPYTAVFKQAGSLPLLKITIHWASQDPALAVPFVAWCHWKSLPHESRDLRRVRFISGGWIIKIFSRTQLKKLRQKVDINCRHSAAFRLYSICKETNYYPCWALRIFSVEHEYAETNNIKTGAVA